LNRSHSLIYRLMTLVRGWHRGSLYWWWSDSNLLSASVRIVGWWTSGRRLRWRLWLCLAYLSRVERGQAAAHASWRLRTSRRKWCWLGRSQIRQRRTLWPLTNHLRHWCSSRSSWSHRSWSQARSRRAWTRRLAWSHWLIHLSRRLLGLLLRLMHSRCGTYLTLRFLHSSLCILIVAVVCVQAVVESLLLRRWKHVAASALDVHLIELLLNRHKLVLAHRCAGNILWRVSLVVWES